MKVENGTLRVDLDNFPTEIPFRRTMEYLWNETGGLIFSATFRKKNGEMRTMVCRRYVKAHLRGGELPYEPKPRLLLPVFDMHIQDYRMVNLNTLVGFNAIGERFLVTD